MKAERLLEMCVLLLNRGTIQAGELAERFAVSERTIYRDMEALSRSGIPVVAYPGRNGGYGLVEGFKMDRQLLNNNELSALEASLSGLSRSFRDHRWAHTSEKLKSLTFRERGGVARKQPSEYLCIDFGNSPHLQKILPLLREAIENGRRVRFTYQDAAGNLTEREVEPMILHFAEAAWYLYGYCLLRADYRVFRISRIRALQILPGRSEPRRTPSATILWNDSPDQDCLTLRLRFSGSSIVPAEDYFGPEALLPDTGGARIVEISFPENDWLYRFLLGFGCGLEVLEPQSVRRELSARAECIFKTNLTDSDRD